MPGGTFEDLDADVARRRHREAVKRGRDARTLRPRDASVDDVTSALERLARLVEAGVLSRSEMARLRAELFAERWERRVHRNRGATPPNRNRGSGHHGGSP